jgi:hypothetical protein
VILRDAANNRFDLEKLGEQEESRLFHSQGDLLVFKSTNEGLEWAQDHRTGTAASKRTWTWGQFLEPTTKNEQSRVNARGGASQHCPPFGIRKQRDGGET